jgi:hypothetical protein
MFTELLGEALSRKKRHSEVNSAFAVPIPVLLNHTSLLASEPPGEEALNFWKDLGHPILTWRNVSPWSKEPELQPLHPRPPKVSSGLHLPA